ncbi:MAG: Stp1/IreP family PP2C-type Ser/Thr phosphatase [Oligoflexia bacterium]|nr:Stp1/IreP family PP2C-type Ser/Thr phosphatase [Oligoflexia bacterium]
MVRYRVGHATDIGRKRSQNQDNYFADAEQGLFLVADGMGGHKGGETASSMAAEIIPRLVREGQRSDDWVPSRVISHAIETASSTIFERSAKETSLHGMGTTTTALLFKGAHLAVGHVGDSRCYLIKGDAIWQATRDHSLVQEKLRAGLITRAEVKTDRMKNVITRSVGFEPRITVEIYEMTVQPGDVFVICSDGLSGLVSDLEILQLVERDLHRSGDLERTVKSLIDAANANGGDDNITTVVVQVTE